jgi:uncharacterized membrane protein
MKQNFELRNEAFELLKANWKQPVLLYFIISMICGVIYCFAPSVVADIFILYPCGYVFVMQLMSFMRDGKQNLVSDYFKLFKDKYMIALPVVALTYLYTFLWTLLFIIPGIIKGYSYALASYISIEDNNIPAEECINKSMQMMEGHKMRLFLLDLSFIGWYFVAFLTFGIGLFWVVPYHEMARLLFYEDLKSQQLLIEE